MRILEFDERFLSNIMSDSLSFKGVKKGFEAGMSRLRKRDVSSKTGQNKPHLNWE